MKELDKDTLLAILEDLGIDTTKRGLSKSDIDEVLASDLEVIKDELDPLFEIICQEIQNARPDLKCVLDSHIFKILRHGEDIIDFEVKDADMGGGDVTIFLVSPYGESTVHIDESGEVNMENLLEKIEQAEFS